MNNLKDLLKESHEIVVLTGAGVSTDSGIPDFKESDENWTHKVPRIEAISLPYFLQEPDSFWKIYREVFSSKFTAEPNSFHYYLAELEKTHKVTIITQNVDGLHKAAGSTHVIEAHGNLKTLVCLQAHCKARYPVRIFEDKELPRCIRCNFPLKPNVSLFFEGITGMDKARAALKTSDLFITAGTSLLVGPINEIPFIAEINYPQDRLWINRDKPPYDYNFQYKFIGEMKNFLKEVSN